MLLTLVGFAIISGHKCTKMYQPKHKTAMKNGFFFVCVLVSFFLFVCLFFGGGVCLSFNKFFTYFERQLSMKQIGKL